MFTTFLDNKLKTVNEAGKLKKNCASNRMKNLKQKLSLELAKEKEESAKLSKQSQLREIVDLTETGR